MFFICNFAWNQSFFTEIFLTKDRNKTYLREQKTIFWGKWSILKYTDTFILLLDTPKHSKNYTRRLKNKTKPPKRTKIPK